MAPDPSKKDQPRGDKKRKTRTHTLHVVIRLKSYPCFILRPPAAHREDKLRSEPGMPKTFITKNVLKKVV